MARPRSELIPSSTTRVGFVFEPVRVNAIKRRYGRSVGGVGVVVPESHSRQSAYIVLLLDDLYDLPLCELDLDPAAAFRTFLFFASSCADDAGTHGLAHLGAIGLFVHGPVSFTT